MRIIIITLHYPYPAVQNFITVTWEPYMTFWRLNGRSLRCLVLDRKLTLKRTEWVVNRLPIPSQRSLQVASIGKNLVLYTYTFRRFRSWCSWNLANSRRKDRPPSVRYQWWRCTQLDWRQGSYRQAYTRDTDRWSSFPVTPAVGESS